MKGVFVGATGTGCGKTWVSRGLARAAARRGLRVAALKPIETGVADLAADALALAASAGRPELADAPNLVRLRAPLSPRAASLAGERAVDVHAVIAATRAAWSGSDLAVVEGAGGMLVPVSRETTIATLAAGLGLPVVLVAPNALGTLSHTLSAWESCRARALAVRAIVLVQRANHDGSERSNGAIIREETGVITMEFPICGDDDERLAEAAEPLARQLELW